MAAIDRLIRNLVELKLFGTRFMLRKLLPWGREGDVWLRTKQGSYLIRVPGSDYRTMTSVIGQKCYDLSGLHQHGILTEAIARSRREGRIPLIIDCGANIGLSARFFAERYPDAVVVALEPDGDNVRICRANVRHLGNVRVIPAAVGSRPGLVKLDFSNGSGDAVRTVRDAEGVDVVTVPGIRSMFGGCAVVLIKIDIEGFESDLFAHHDAWMDETPFIIVELHDWMLPNKGSSIGLQRWLMDRGREIIVCGENLALIKRGLGSEPATPGSFGEARMAVDVARPTASVEADRYDRRSRAAHGDREKADSGIDL